jgi:alpha,alpha-trehalase
MIQTEGAFFQAVQMGQVFPDSKTFVDCAPKIPADEILQKYAVESEKADFDLKSFVLEHFVLPEEAQDSTSKIDTTSVETYINSLWEVLKRTPKDKRDGDTLLPLAYPYIVPGGRFGEIYYWDSFFTAVGLATEDKYDIIESMVKNFIHLLNTVGLIPNGNREYYTSRSQPPVLGFMIDLLYAKYGIDYIKPYVFDLEKEYNFWMDTHSVNLSDGGRLNLYRDNASVPRQESYKEDFTLGKDLATEDAKKLFNNLRSGAESGWDFTSRWFADPMDIATIQTTDIIPIDLNALLYGTEQLLTKYFKELGDAAKSAAYAKKAEDRVMLINKYCWDNDAGFFFDYNHKTNTKVNVYGMSGAVPLFVAMASDDQADKVEKVLENKFLKPGGFVTTTLETGQQWDAPNGWPPLQWFGVKGLLNYGKKDLAYVAMERWVKMVRNHFAKAHALMEKYNVCEPDVIAGGGEYSVQEGFGWTNGITLKFIKMLQNK